MFIAIPMIHRVFRGHPRWGRQLYFTCPSAPDPLFEASKAPFLALRADKGEVFLLTVGAFLLAVELLCLQSVKVLLRRAFPL